MRPHTINESNNFIMGWYAEDLSFVDQLIKYHTFADIKRTDTFDASVKESVDVSTPLEDQPDYSKHLDMCFGKYFEKYIGAKQNCGMWFAEYPNIQHYPIGGGFKMWHAERTHDSAPNVTRHLVFMTYLNDVPDGGTEFMYQNLTVKAEKGLTIVWPADWTFTHRSQVSNTMEKWIITGWINLKDRNENRNMQ